MVKCFWTAEEVHEYWIGVYRYFYIRIGDPPLHEVIDRSLTLFTSWALAFFFQIKSYNIYIITYL